MKKKVIRDISASSLQVIINQLSGVLIFYFSSRYLFKQSFGEINWSVAVLVTAFNILGCGIDQITVKQVASGADAKKVLTLYFTHVLLTGALFYGLLLAACLFFPAFFRNHAVLLLMAVSQLLIFFSMPFKQVATGKEKFRLLLLMSTCSNLLKVIALAILGNRLTINLLVYVYIISSAIELGFCVYITRVELKLPFRLKWDKTEYIALIRHSLPQLGSIIFNSAVARFDWILLGLMSTTVVLAEYSFAYKVFELSTLPLLIIAPLLLPRFTRFFSHASEEYQAGKKQELLVVVRYEIIIASLTALVLNLAWGPVIDALTNNKYGKVNIQTIFYLSLAIPFLYMNNFLWSVNFAQGHLKKVFVLVGIAFFINLVGDIALIPFYGAAGAAIAYLLAIVIQSVFYVKTTAVEDLGRAFGSLFIIMGLAVASGLTSKYIFNNAWAALPAGICMFALLLVIFKQVKMADRPVFKRIITT